MEEKEIAGLGKVAYIVPVEENQTIREEAQRKNKEMVEKLFRTPPDGVIIPEGNGKYSYVELSEEEKRRIANAMGWIKDK